MNGYAVPRRLAVAETAAKRGQSPGPHGPDAVAWHRAAASLIHSFDTIG